MIYYFQKDSWSLDDQNPPRQWLTFFKEEERKEERGFSEEEAQLCLNFAIWFGHTNRWLCSLNTCSSCNANITVHSSLIDINPCHLLHHLCLWSAIFPDLTGTQTKGASVEKFSTVKRNWWSTLILARVIATIASGNSSPNPVHIKNATMSHISSFVKPTDIVFFLFILHLQPIRT